MRNRPLRVGVVIDGPRVPAWAAWIVERVREHDQLELASAVVAGSPPSRRTPALFRLYQALDRRLFREPADALDPVDLSAVLEGLAKPDESSLDVLISLTGRPPAGDVDPVPRYGVWVLHLGDPERFRGEPEFFWELFGGEPASTSVLEIFEQGARRGWVIYRSVSATDPVSLQRNRNDGYWKAAKFVLRRLEDLAAGRWTPAPEPPVGSGAPKSAPPSNATTLRHVGRIAGRALRRKLRAKAFREQWFLGLRERRPETLPDDDPRPWRVELPPGDRYWADPFVFAADGETFVFLEQVRWDRGLGELAVGRLEDGRLTDLEAIIPAEHHLSYPYVFRDRGRSFMIPESAAANRVELWAATEFPLGWELVGALLEDVPAVDVSVLEHDGLYWMWFGFTSGGARRDDETFLYFSDRLDSGWTPHPRNPVVSDARRARPAGRPFRLGGRLIRPAQDSTRGYGTSVVFNAVTRLSVDEYSEEPIGSLTAAWAGGRSLGAHTYSFDGEWEATDGMRILPRWRRRA
jgi:hypothetical protein